MVTQHTPASRRPWLLFAAAVAAIPLGGAAVASVRPASGPVPAIAAPVAPTVTLPVADPATMPPPPLADSTASVPSAPITMTPAPVASTPGCRITPDREARWRAAVTATQVRTGSALGVAVATTDGAIQLGSWATGPAWSTAKVPLTIAVTRAYGAEGRPAREDALPLESALTASDNAAAAYLWNRLGGGGTAATAMTSVLRDAGDSTTTVPSTQRVAGFSVFGQTTWSLTAQASFATTLDRVSGASATLSAMGRIRGDQRWGLGAVSQITAFKGGWGPAPTGGYLVRQFGVGTLPSGQKVGVAVAALAPGGFSVGTSSLDALAADVSSMLADLGAGC